MTNTTTAPCLSTANMAIVNTALAMIPALLAGDTIVSRPSARWEDDAWEISVVVSRTSDGSRSRRHMLLARIVDTATATIVETTAATIVETSASATVI